MIDKRDLIRDFINNTFLVDSDKSYTDTDSLLDLGIINSTGVLDLMLFLEDTFKIIIKDDEVTPDNLDSISKIIKFVESKIE